MKYIVIALIAILAVAALGGVLGVGLGNGSGAQVMVPEKAAVAQPDASSAKVSTDNRVGVVGVLQAIGSSSLSLQTRDGLQLLTINGTAGIDKDSSAIDQLKVGDKVAIWAQQIDGQTVVRKVVVVPQSPERMHYVGLIATVGGDHLDVVGQQGETTSFRFDATLQKLPEADYAPQVGDTVTVVAKPDPLGDGWLAVAVVKQ
jgi:hypothetical protein